MLNSLAPFVPTAIDPWDAAKVKHLYRRAAYGADPAMLAEALSRSPGEVVDALIEGALGQQMSYNPAWRDWARSNYTNYVPQNQAQTNTVYEFAVADLLGKGLRGRMTLFWWNHFVTRLDSYHHAPYLFQYYELLFNFGSGNFRDLTRFVGRTNAMLIYLNGFDNRAEAPNENYARELLELFTLGVDNGYTQDDIIDLSRAFTGYTARSEFGAPIQFDARDFDGDEKTIFGRAGFYNYPNAVALLFAERAPLIADFISGKLYRFFVSPQIDQDVVAAMADRLLASDWEIAPVLRELFSSAHFYSKAARGTLIKSPFDLLCGFVKELNFDYSGSEREVYDYIYRTSAFLGQDYFNPVDVAGWRQDRDWLNSNSLSERWARLEPLLQKFFNANVAQFANFARTVAGGEDRDTAIITRAVVDHFMVEPINDEEAYAIAESVLQWELPSNYYEPGGIWSLDSESASYQVFLLLRHVGRMPEFQLD